MNQNECEREARPRILVVEDDASIAKGLVHGLKEHGFDVELETNGQAGLRQALRHPPDLVLLDLMLPELDGFSILKQLQVQCSAPVIVLTARQDLEARLDSFASGAVDYVAKPFWIEELVARIQVRLQRSLEQGARTLCWGDVTLDLEARTLRRGAEPIHLTPNEFNIFLFLVERPERALTRDQIAEHALPMQEERLDRTIDSHIARIRKKLGSKRGACVATVWGLGYKFQPSCLEDAAKEV